MKVSVTYQCLCSEAHAKDLPYTPEKWSAMSSDRSAA